MSYRVQQTEQDRLESTGYLDRTPSTDDIGEDTSHFQNTEPESSQETTTRTLAEFADSHDLSVSELSAIVEAHQENEPADQMSVPSREEEPDQSTQYDRASRENTETSDMTTTDDTGESRSGSQRQRIQIAAGVQILFVSSAIVMAGLLLAEGNFASIAVIALPIFFTVALGAMVWEYSLSNPRV